MDQNLQYPVVDINSDSAPYAQYNPIIPKPEATDIPSYTPYQNLSYTFLSLRYTNILLLVLLYLSTVYSSNINDLNIYLLSLVFL